MPYSVYISKFAFNKIQGGYAGMAWAFYSQMRSGGYFVHQWNIRFRDLQDAVYARCY